MERDNVVFSREYKNAFIICRNSGNKLKHKIYIFGIKYVTENELLDNWKQFNNDIAYEYQRLLKSSIEKYNIYCFYFVKEKISKRKKLEIEQNRYATRKFVVDNINIDNEIGIDLIIKNKLFCLGDLKKDNFLEEINYSEEVISFLKNMNKKRKISDKDSVIDNFIEELN